MHHGKRKKSAKMPRSRKKNKITSDVITRLTDMAFDIGLTTDEKELDSKMDEYIYFLDELNKKYVAKEIRYLKFSIENDIKSFRSFFKECELENSRLVKFNQTQTQRKMFYEKVKKSFEFLFYSVE